VCYFAGPDGETLELLQPAPGRLRAMAVAIEAQRREETTREQFHA
jgi:hypothetical protein